MLRFLIQGVALFTLFSSLTFADNALLQRKDAQAFIHDMVTTYHMNQQDVTDALREAKFQKAIIDSMEKPYEKKSWDKYKAYYVTPERLKGGIQFWEANQKNIDAIAKKYRVPAEIIIAIIGVETRYGANQGNYRVLDALTTLAFDYPKRSEFFTKELKEYLLLCKEHHVPATYYKGSYAGAIGKPQFMPSSYRYYAIDYDKKGQRDLIENNADVIASVANYLHKHGWKMNQGIAQAAVMSSQPSNNITVNPKAANYRYSQLAGLGVRPVSYSQNHPYNAGIIELITKKGNEYWLAYPNFFVITRYNTSPQYALAVYLLSLQLKQQWEMLRAKKPHGYA
jgi:membrane-bound lytic murein transglycosylase B